MLIYVCGVDTSAAADRRIRRRKFVRQKYVGNIAARRISRRILLDVNPPEKRSAAEFFCIFITVHRYALLIFCIFSQSVYKLVLCGS